MAPRFTQPRLAQILKVNGCDYLNYQTFIATLAPYDYDCEYVLAYLPTRFFIIQAVTLDYEEIGMNRNNILFIQDVDGNMLWTGNDYESYIRPTWAKAPNENRKVRKDAGLPRKKRLTIASK